MRAPLLCVIGVSLWSAATVARQAAPPATLPPELRAHVQTGRLDMISSIRGLPLGVRNEMQWLFGGGDLRVVERFRCVCRRARRRLWLLGSNSVGGTENLVNQAIFLGASRIEIEICPFGIANDLPKGLSGTVGKDPIDLALHLLESIEMLSCG